MIMSIFEIDHFVFGKSESSLMKKPENPFVKTSNICWKILAIGELGEEKCFYQLSLGRPLDH